MFRPTEFRVVALAVALAIGLVAGADQLFRAVVHVAVDGMPLDMIGPQPCPCGGLLTIENGDFRHLHCKTCGRSAPAQTRDSRFGSR
jgi:hypothetical protein